MKICCQIFAQPYTDVGLKMAHYFKLYTGVSIFVIKWMMVIFVTIQDDSHYEITSQVREQLKFLEGIDRVHTKRKQEQEREKLLKAAKVS